MKADLQKIPPGHQQAELVFLSKSDWDLNQQLPDQDQVIISLHPLLLGISGQLPYNEKICLRGLQQS